LEKEAVMTNPTIPLTPQAYEARRAEILAELQQTMAQLEALEQELCALTYSYYRQQGKPFIVQVPPGHLVTIRSS
jgi:hypothetical protein